MRKKILLGVIALTVVVAGLAALSAFTAQIVNIQAHAEKDIALEPVICTAQSGFGQNYNEPCFVDPNGGNYGVTLPQEFYDKEIELTLSNSFFEQDRFFDIDFAMLWECKQVIDPVTGEVVDADGDTIGDCRVDLLDDTICKIDLDGDTKADTLQHCDPQKLDGPIRGHIEITTKGGETSRCQRTLGDPGFSELTPSANQAQAWVEKDIEFQFSGTINKGAPKCRYELKFFSPPCVSGFNENTDPHPDLDIKQPVDCHKNDKMRHVGKDDDGDAGSEGGVGPNCTDGQDNDGDTLIDLADPDCDPAKVDEDPINGIDDDGDTLIDEDPGAESVNPQDIDEFVDIGDDFKIQVTGHSLPPSAGCQNAVFDTCVDGDGIATDGPGTFTIQVGDPILSASALGNQAGLDLIDRGVQNGVYDAGDDLMVEDPFGTPTCPNAFRDAVYDNNPGAQDCVVLDPDGSLTDGDFVTCDTGSGCGLWFRDDDGDGRYDVGEDLVVDGNNNGIFD